MRIVDFFVKQEDELREMNEDGVYSSLLSYIDDLFNQNKRLHGNLIVRISAHLHDLGVSQLQERVDSVQYNINRS